MQAASREMRLTVTVGPAALDAWIDTAQDDVEPRPNRVGQATEMSVH